MKIRVSGIIALLCVLLFTASASVCAGVLKVRRPAEDAELKRLIDARVNRWIDTPVKDVPSKRQLLRSSQKKLPQALAEVGPDTLRICAIRVEFENVPDPSKITGSGGRFDLSDKRDVIPIDPPPHDRKYFSKHMEALAYYYGAMSYGNLKIEWEIFPLSNEGAYVLPSVGDYNPGGGSYTWTLEGLERFFRDAIATADKDADLLFSDYDAVVIFHAGSDWQNDIYGDSPYDIPSFFVSLAETAAIAVDDSTHFIIDGGVVPETTSQDGFFNGINGVLAHEMGHQLGLPDLYDTFSGISVLVYWGLMDFGSGVGVVVEDTLADEAYFVTGIVPASLCAWSKAYLGWAVPDTVRGQAKVSLKATELQEGFPSKDMLIVPINSNEYYLLENRQSDLDGDNAGFLLADPSEDSTGVIIGPVDGNGQPNYEFDFALPGSGILIWHIDRMWVDFLNPYDLINAFPERRGIRLEEADGIPDLGDMNSFYFLGGPDDPFRAGNNDRFADNTYPNTRSNTGCHSHIVIDQISQSAVSMNLRVSYDWAKSGFPVALGDSMRFGVPSLLVFDVDGDGKDEIQATLKRAYFANSDSVVYLRSELYSYEMDSENTLRLVDGWPRRLHGSHPTEIAAVNLDGVGELESVVADETGRLYAFSHDGTPYFEDSDSLGSFYKVQGTINGVPVGFDLEGDGSEELVVGTERSLVVLSGESISEVDTLLVIEDEQGFSQPVIAEFLSGPEGPEIISYKPGRLEIVAGDTWDRAAIPVSCSLDPGEVYLALADLDRDPDEALEIIVVGKNGWVWVVNGAVEVPGWGRQITSQVVSPPAFADVNSDSFLEIVVNDDESRSWVLLRGGSTLGGWPKRSYGCDLPVWDAEFYPPDRTIPVPSAILADLDCDGTLNIIQGSMFECITGWEPAGDRLNGFPVTLGGGCSSVSLGDLDGDGRTELVAGGGDGYIYAFLHPDTGADGCLLPWPTAYFNRARNSVYPLELMPEEPEIGDRLLVMGTFHAYPNPAGPADPVTGEKVVKFTFETETGGAATIDIFDVSGVKIRSVWVDASSYSPGIPTVPVDITDLPNGLYVCRLSIEGKGETASEFFKLAVKR